jgi:chromosome segregation ATPase
MFDSKEDLYDFLLTNDFSEKYSDADYKYFLLGFKSLLRELYSENSRLKQHISSLEQKIENTNTEIETIKHRLLVNNNIIKQLHKRLQKCKPWYKKLFNIK